LSDTYPQSPDDWSAGDAYEAYMGRWSRPVARAFVEWLAPAPGSHWLEIGCGTGALTAAVCAHAAPASIVGCDTSPPFIEHARAAVPDPRASFVIGGAEDPPLRQGGFDAAISGLVLNFLPWPERAIAHLRDRLRPGGLAAAYVWDYAEGMELLRIFWDEAVALDRDAAALDEGRRFPLASAGALADLFTAVGLAEVQTAPLTAATDFADFDDYWRPFLGRTGPAPSYVASLEPPRAEALRERLRRRLGAGPIRLHARAWAVRGVRQSG
jgi:SAM-dependent methyltransferase